MVSLHKLLGPRRWRFHEFFWGFFVKMISRTFHQSKQSFCI